ncbi:hypothetical protein N405_03770 [Helicobacter pylori FD568]|nr:hypothetical protein N405_03770 [Helicobacter pylori FD568]
MQWFSNNRVLILFCATTHFSGGGVHLEANSKIRV